MRRLLLLAALTLGASAAHADDGFFYLGAGISKNKVSEITNGGGSFGDLDNTSWKVLAGFRPISVVAVEADYLDLGSQTNNCHEVAARRQHATDATRPSPATRSGSCRSRCRSSTCMARRDSPRWKLEGTLRIRHAPREPSSGSRSRAEFAWGVGAQAHIGKIGGRLEYESFSITNTSGAKVFSLAVILSLL